MDQPAAGFQPAGWSFILHIFILLICIDAVPIRGVFLRNELMRVNYSVGPAQLKTHGFPVLLYFSCSGGVAPGA